MTQETVTIIRPSFKKICAGSSCQAALFNHTLYWIAQKSKEGCGYWYDTGESIYHAMAETWGISIIRREINALVDSHLIGETNNPKWGADRTKHFYFGEEQAKTFFTACEKHEVCLFCIGLCEDVLTLILPHLIDLTNAIIRFNKCICQNHQMQVIDLLNASDRSIKAITKISSKITYKEKDTNIGVSATISHPSSFTDTESPVTADTSATTGQVAVIPIATATTRITDVTQPHESEPTYGHTTSVAPDLPGGTHRGTHGTQHPLSALAGETQGTPYPNIVESESTHADLPVSTHCRSTDSSGELPAVPTHNVTTHAVSSSQCAVSDGTHGRGMSEAGHDGDVLEPRGYEKGEPHATLDTARELPGISDADRGDRVHLSMLPVGCTDVPDPQEITPAMVANMPVPDGMRQPTPVQFDPPTDVQVLNGDARERTVTPPDAALLRSHTSFYDIDLLAEDTWVVIPGRTTERIPGEGIQRTGDTSSDATSQSTETPAMKPASPNKTGQARENKKTRGKSEAQPETLMETALVEPDMHGIWNHEKVVQYTEWCNKQRYRDTERTRQLNAAKAIYKDDHTLTLEHYRLAYDERNDEWWQETKGALHVTHMRGKEKSGIDRLHAMLDKIAARKQRKDQQKPPSNEVKVPSVLTKLDDYTWDGTPLTYLPRQETRSRHYGKTLHA